MSITLATGSMQTINSSTAPRLIQTPAGAASAYSVDDPGNAVVTNIAGALDQPNTIRYSVNAVADVFKQSPVNPSPGQNPAGVNILVQVNEVWKVTDTDLGERLLPVSGHFVLKLPTDAAITATAVAALIDRVVGSSMRADNGTLETGVDFLLHGVTRIPIDPSV